MQILIGLLAALAGAFWAFTYFVGAARQGREAVDDVRGLIRNGKWSRQIGKRLVENIDDPREAAAVLLYQMAAYDGAVTDRQKAAIVAEMKKAFAADDETAEGLYAFARAAVGQINDAANNLRKIVRSIVEKCDETERRQFVAMVETIGEVEGPLSDIQRRLVAEIRRCLLPST